MSQLIPHHDYAVQPPNGVPGEQKQIDSLIQTSGMSLAGGQISPVPSPGYNFADPLLPGYNDLTNPASTPKRISRKPVGGGTTKVQAQTQAQSEVPYYSPSSITSNVPGYEPSSPTSGVPAYESISPVTDVPAYESISQVTGVPAYESISQVTDVPAYESISPVTDVPKYESLISSPSVPTSPSTIHSLVSS